MKLLCLLFSVYVLLLSAKPCCADSDCQPKQVAGKMQAEKLPVKDDACPDCPPFSICSASASFIFNTPVVINTPVSADTHLKHTAVYKQPALPQISLSIWQPPKLG